MSLKEYSFSVKATGTYYCTAEAESEEEAIQLIKNGDGYLLSSESEFESFHLDSVTDVVWEDDEDEC